MFCRQTIYLLFALVLHLSAEAACNALPAEMVGGIPVGVWRPGTEREWMNVGLIRFASDEVQLGGDHYQLCFIEKLRSRGEVSVVLQGEISLPSDVLVFSVQANKGKRPYSNSRILGVSQFSVKHLDGTKENWVEAYWCQKLEDIRGGRFWCSTNSYICEEGACLQP